MAHESFKFSNIERFSNIADNIIFSSSGDYSDYQKLRDELKEHHRKEKTYSNIDKPSPQRFGSYLSQLCYKKRNKVDPYLVEAVLGGIQDGKPFLCLTDMYGNYFEHNYFATSFGRYLCPPLIE